MSKDHMTTWKRLAIRSLFFGAGFALMAAVIGGGIAWYNNRPESWNTKAITAEYDGVDTEGEKNTLVFYYTLHNNTKKDYTISEYSKIPIFAKFDDERLSGNHSVPWLTYDKPLFIPAGHKIRFLLHLKSTYPKNYNKDVPREEQKNFRKKIEKYLGEKYPNLDGFVLFDKSDHYEIRLPRGWEIADSEDSTENEP